MTVAASLARTPSRSLGARSPPVQMFTDDEIAKRQQRAERFGPTTGAAVASWTEKAADAEKKAARAVRFGTAEDPDKLKARAARFGVATTTQDDAGLMDVDLHQERKEVGADVERRLEVVHIYGVDLLSTKDILNYFGDYGAKFIEWINDSSANVVFNDAGTAERALVGLGSPMLSSELPEGATLSDPSAIKYVWFKGSDFIKAGSSIPLVFRVATVLDVKPAERVKSRRLWVSAGGGGRGGRGRDHGGKGRGRGAKGGVGKKKGGRRQPRENQMDVEDDDGARGRRLVEYDDL